MARPKDVLAAAQAAGGPEALRGLPVIALGVTVFDGCDPSDPSTLAERCVLVEPVVHPVLEAQLDLTTATRRGRFTWSIGLGDDCDPRPLSVLLNAARRGLVIHKDGGATQGGKARDLNAVAGYGLYNRIDTEMAGTPLNATWRHWRQGPGLSYPDERPYRFGAVLVSSDGRNLWMKVVTHNLVIPEESGFPAIPLNLAPAGRQRSDPKPVLGAEAVAVIDWAIAAGLTVVDLSGDGAVARLRRSAERSLCVRPYPGRPAEGLASVGRRVAHEVRKALGATYPIPTAANALAPTTGEQVSELVKGLDPATVYVHPAVADVAQMAHAVPVNRSDLLKHQPEAVGLHLATHIGFVNAMAPGVGKTPTTLVAMAMRSEHIPAYRGLCIVEANVRDQWSREAARFFPKARCVVLEARSQLDELTETLSSAGDDPVVVITSYALAASAAAAELPEESAAAVVAEHATQESIGQLLLFDPSLPTLEEDEEDAGNGDRLGLCLLGEHWHDIVADEAVCLRNSATKLSDAMWALRARADVALALTGTPIDKGLDDLGKMLAWVRNDPYLFYGNRLSANFDVSDSEQLQGFLRAVGPLVYRVDKSEISDELPEVTPEVVKLTPTPAEKNLAAAARTELKRAYQDLMAAVEMAEGTDDSLDPAQVAQVKEALRLARGAWLGGTTLARMAASDPAALVGSNSAGAALLAAQGLVAAATQDAGTKRRWAVDFCTKEVAGGEKVLFFTDFSSVAEGLIADLRAAGLRVGAVLGGGGKRRDRDIAAFMAGSLDVLVATKAGERGLNLQIASVLVHYDLPWIPSSVVQRAGRCERRGAIAQRVRVVFPVMEHTIEERVAALVVARAMVAMLALDAHRGVRIADTDLGRALGGLALEVDASQLSGKESNMLTMTRELLAA